MKKAWWKEAVIYQIYPRSFKDSNNDGIGDIRGIIEKVDYIKSLGVDVVWLCPVYQSPNDDNGYDISDYRAIHPEFGTMQDWEELLTALHENGIRLIMDLVVNHTSDEHGWFIESRKSRDNPYRDYYIWRDGKESKNPLPNNWTSFFGGNTWEFDPDTGQYYLHLFSKKQPDLNWENPCLRREVFDMMNWWLDKGIDGFRMDVINLLSKTEGLPSVGDDNTPHWGGEYFINGPKMGQYLDEMYRNCLCERDIMTVGEMPGVTIDKAKEYAGENAERLNMVFQFELMDLDGSKMHPKHFDITAFKAIIAKWQKGLENDGWNSIYLNNHDQPRMVSRFGDDQVYHNESAKMLATLNLTLKGTPYIYQGEEIGMTNVRFSEISQFRDIESLNLYREYVPDRMSREEAIAALNRRSRDNARTPMQWDSSRNAGFCNTTPWIEVNNNYIHINVAAQEEDQNSILSYYKSMIRIRKENPVLIYGTFDMIKQENDAVFAYTREYEQEKALVLLNFSGDRTSVSLPDDNASWTYLTGNYNERDLNILRPYEAKVFLRT